MDEVVTGIRGDVALKIFAPDLDVRDQLCGPAADRPRTEAFCRLQNDVGGQFENERRADKRLMISRCSILCLARSLRRTCYQRPTPTMTYTPAHGPAKCRHDEPFNGRGASKNREHRSSVLSPDQPRAGNGPILAAGGAGVFSRDREGLLAGQPSCSKSSRASFVAGHRAARRMVRA